MVATLRGNVQQGGFVADMVISGGIAGNLITSAIYANALPTTFEGSNITALNASSITTGTLAVGRGGTGVASSTGSGNVVLSDAPTLQGNVNVTGNVSTQGLVVSGYVKQTLLTYIRTGFGLAANYGTTYTTLTTNGLSGYITYTVDAVNGDYFTANKAGVYALTAGTCIADPGSGNVIAGFNKNGTNLSPAYLGIASLAFGTYWNELILNTVVALQVNDTIRVNVQKTNTRTLGAQAPNMTYTILFLYAI